LKNQNIVLDWIARLSRQDGLTILFTTHHPHHALAVADTALLMLRNAPEQGPAKEVLSEVNLHALYGVNMKHLSFEHLGEKHETLVPILPYASSKNPDV